MLPLRLLLQAFLFAHEVPRSFVNMLLPMGTAIVALAAALAAYLMVKFFGVIFLGQPREPNLAHAHDASVLERIGLAWLGAGKLRPEVSDTGLEFRTMKAGTGAPIRREDAAVMDYVLTSDDGTVVDSSSPLSGS